MRHRPCLQQAGQLTANTVRVWSFGKVRILKNTAKMKANTIGFYAIRGKASMIFWKIPGQKVSPSSWKR
jgi:hypothetical protein